MSDIKHHFSSGVYVREQSLKALQTVSTHKHKFDHLGILVSGCASVEVDGKGQTYKAPCVIEIAAGKSHRIIALTDIAWMCVHATSVCDPEMIDHELVEA